MTDSASTTARPLETAYLAGGCFWGMQDLLRRIPGVIDTEVGYTGGWLENPRYDDTHDSKSGHAEAVKIVFDPAVLAFEDLLVHHFFRMHDPSTLNRQGNDRGTQYRSAIFFTSAAQETAALTAVEQVQASGLWRQSIVTQIAPFSRWWPGEDDHQDYLVRYPNGYTCHYMR